MKKLENWIIKITDKNHYKEVIKVLDDLGYNTEHCDWVDVEMYRVKFLYCRKNVCIACMYNYVSDYKLYTLEEFVKAHNTFKNMKFRISSKEEDEKLQKYLFTLGYEWFCGEKKYFCATGEYNKFLYTRDMGILGWTDYDSYFDNYHYPEYTLQEIITYELKELKEVVKVHCKNCGKEIDTNMKNNFKFNNGSYLCWDCFKEVSDACFPF